MVVLQGQQQLHMHVAASWGKHYLCVLLLLGFRVVHALLDMSDVALVTFPWRLLGLVCLLYLLLLKQPVGSDLPTP